MQSPISITKTDLALIATAIAAVLLSGLALDRRAHSHRVLAQDTAPPVHVEVVGQSATAPDARHDVPAIVAAAFSDSAAPPCPITLDLLDEGNAIIGGVLRAPCQPSEDLVIAHAGLVFSGKTLASGTLLFSLPALKASASVAIRFANGAEAQAQIDMPDARTLQRVAVQWPHDGGFDLHAFQAGAAFGTAGHIWRQAAGTPLAGDGGAADGAAGYLTQLGDSAVAMPLMAQVFTFGPSAQTDVLLEAAVTPSTCGQELMADVLTAVRGTVEKSELTLAMPDCGALGEYVQIGNIMPELNLALAR
jgi:hypothetical protein